MAIPWQRSWCSKRQCLDSRWLIGLDFLDQSSLEMSLLLISFCENSYSIGKKHQKMNAHVSKLCMVKWRSQKTTTKQIGYFLKHVKHKMQFYFWCSVLVNFHLMPTWASNEFRTIQLKVESSDAWQSTSLDERIKFARGFVVFFMLTAPLDPKCHMEKCKVLCLKICVK